MQFLFIEILSSFLLYFQPEKPSVSAASTLTNKRTTDTATAISAGYPKRAKRPILDDVPMPSNGPSISTANLAALSSSERDKLLQMLEQESSVRILCSFRVDEFLFLDRRTR